MREKVLQDITAEKDVTEGKDDVSVEVIGGLVKRIEFVGIRELGIVDVFDVRDVDGLSPEAADDDNVAKRFGAELGDEFVEERLAVDRDHGFRTSVRERAEIALRSGEDDRAGGIV